MATSVDTILAFGSDCEEDEVIVAARNIGCLEFSGFILLSVRALESGFPP
jgi:hypothetical protein